MVLPAAAAAAAAAGLSAQEIALLVAGGAIAAKSAMGGGQKPQSNLSSLTDLLDSQTKVTGGQQRQATPAELMMTSPMKLIEGVMKSVIGPGGRVIAEDPRVSGERAKDELGEIVKGGFKPDLQPEQKSMDDFLEGISIHQPDPRAGVEEFPATAPQIPTHTEFPTEAPRIPPFMTREGTEEDPYPLRNDFDQPVDKFNYYLPEQKYETVSQSHFLTAPQGYKSKNLIRGFLNEDQKVFGTRTIDPRETGYEDYTADEMKSLSFDKEWKFAKKMFRAHPELEHFIPSIMSNQEVGLSEHLDINNFTKDRILSREEVIGKETLKLEKEKPFSASITKKPDAITRPESGFYTKTEKAIEQAPMKKMTAEQARAMVSKFGKQDDINQDFLNAWLQSNPKVTKDQLLDFVSKNKTKVQTKVRSDAKTIEKPQENILEQIALGDAPEQTGTVTVPETKYSQYQLPGGTDYEETTFQLDTRANDVLIDDYTTARNALEKYRHDIRVKYSDELMNSFTPTSIEVKLNTVMTLEEREEMDRLYEDTTIASDAVAGETFTSHAYDDPNNFGWMRTNTRTLDRDIKDIFQGDLEGESVLFVEELQKINSQVDNISKGRLEELPQIARNGFTEFGVKQMIEKAVQKGDDIVAWTTGEQQADRYDLSKHAKTIEYVGDSAIWVESQDGRWDLVQSGVSPEDLPKFVGKDIAERIMKQKQEMFPERADRPLRRVSGLDLKVGGEDLKQYYNRNLPSTAQKYIKKLDPDAKVEEFDLGDIPDKIKVHPRLVQGDLRFFLQNERTLEFIGGDSPEVYNTAEQAREAAKEISTARTYNVVLNKEVEADKIAERKRLMRGVTSSRVHNEILDELNEEYNPYEVYDNLGNLIDVFPTESQAKQDIKIRDDSGKKTGKQPGFRITPAMREKVLREGQPLSFNIPDGQLPSQRAGGAIA